MLPEDYLGQKETGGYVRRGPMGSHMQLECTKVKKSCIEIKVTTLFTRISWKSVFTYTGTLFSGTLKEIFIVFCFVLYAILSYTL